MTLVDFLLDRIAEDEDVALTADKAEVSYKWPLWTVCRANVYGHEVGPRGSVEASPARVLAECDAKRRIVEHVRDVRDLIDIAVRSGLDPDEIVNLWADEAILKALALPFASHPDYDQRWRP